MTPNEVARSLGLKIPEGFSTDNVSQEFRAAFLSMLGLYQITGEAMEEEWHLKSGEALVCMTTALGCTAGLLIAQTDMPDDEAEAQIERLAQSIRLNALAHHRMARLGSAPAAGSA